MPPGTAPRARQSPLEPGPGMGPGWRWQLCGALAWPARVWPCPQLSVAVWRPRRGSAAPAPRTSATRGHLSVTPLFKPLHVLALARGASRCCRPGPARRYRELLRRERSPSASAPTPMRGSGHTGSVAPPAPLHLHAMPVSRTSSLLEGESLFNVSISSAFLFLRCFRQWLDREEKS